MNKNISLNETAKAFGLYQQDGNTLVAVALLPQETLRGIVVSAWAYAVTYSAKGLNIPDYDGAVDLLTKRHPSWQIIDRKYVPIGVELGAAADDFQENKQS